MSDETNEAPAPPPTVDPKLTHVASTMKYSSPLICCRFDPQGSYVFASAEDNTVQRFELATGEKVALAAHDSWVYSMAFLPGGEMLVTGGGDGRLIWWATAAEKPAPVRTVDAHAGWVRFLSMSPDGRLLASGGNDNLVRVWKTDDGTLVREFHGHQNNVYSTLFHPSGELLLSGDLLGQVKQWEVKTGKLLRTVDAGDLHTYNGGQGVHYGGVRSMALSPDGKRLACCGLYQATNPLGAVNAPLVLSYDWETLEKKRHVAKDVKGIAWRVMFHPEGGYMIAASGGSGGGFLLFWRPGEEAEFHRFKMPDTARNMDLHPDGAQLATVHFDNSVRISRLTRKPPEPEPKVEAKKS